MARKDAVFEPNDPGVVSSVTDSDDGGVATLDQDYIDEVDTAGESSEEPSELTSSRGDDDPSTPSADEGGAEIDMERLGGGTIDPLDDLGSDTSGSTLLGDLGDDAAGSTMLDDVGIGSDAPDPTDGFDGIASDGGGIPDIDDQSGWTSEGQEGESQGRGTQGGDGQGDGQTMPAPGDQSGWTSEGQEGESQGGSTQGGDGQGDGQTMPTPGDGSGRASGSTLLDDLGAGSTLLGGDTGDLAEMAAEADLGDIEIEFDDSLADTDIGADV